MGYGKQPVAVGSNPAPIIIYLGECDENMDTYNCDDTNRIIVRNMLMNEERQIAQAIMDAQKMQQESFDGEEYTKDITACLLETCTKHGLSPNMWALLNLAMHWWNDIQCWANDVMAGKNILDECNQEPMSDDDVIELTEKGKAYDKARKFADKFRESRLIGPQMEVDLHIPAADTTLKFTPNGQLEVKKEKSNLCDTCEQIFGECKGCPTWLPTDGDSRHVIECDGYHKQDRMVNLCDTCVSDFADCGAEGMECGDGPGNDNVIVCFAYTIKD